MGWSNSVRRKWRRWRALSPREQSLLLQALCLLPLTALALRWMSFRQISRALARLAPLARRGRGKPARQLARTAHLAQLATTYSPGRPSCLPRALILWWLLRRQGIVSDLRVGVRCQGSRFEAHAWVECDGVPVNERYDVRQRFTPFAPNFISPRPIESGRDP